MNELERLIDAIIVEARLEGVLDGNNSATQEDRDRYESAKLLAKQALLGYINENYERKDE